MTKATVSALGTPSSIGTRNPGAASLASVLWTLAIARPEWGPELLGFLTPDADESPLTERSSSHGSQ